MKAIDFKIVLCSILSLYNTLSRWNFYIKWSSQFPIFGIKGEGFSSYLLRMYLRNWVQTSIRYMPMNKAKNAQVVRIFCWLLDYRHGVLYSSLTRLYSVVISHIQYEWNSFLWLNSILKFSKVSKHFSHLHLSWTACS